MQRLIGVGLVLIAACGDDGGGNAVDAQVLADAPPSIDAAGCPALWTVEVHGAQSASAMIAGGALTLTSTDTMQGAAIDVYQAGLTGDFSVSFDFTAWTAAGTGAFAQAGLSADVSNPSEFWVAGIGTFPTVGVGAARQPTGAADLKATALTAGTITYARTGTDLTVTAMTADQTATVTGTFADQPLRVGMQLGSNMGALSGMTSVQITDFRVTSGTGVSADSFDCNSLIAP